MLIIREPQPARQGASKHLIAYGTFNELRWSATGFANHDGFSPCWYILVAKGISTTRWIAYSATGQRLGSGSF